MNNRITFFQLLVACAIGSFFLVSCKKGTIEPMKPWGFYAQSYFPAPVYTFENNKQFFERFELGRELFYDKMLSSDSTISCASCHEQAHIFSAHNTPFSTGVNGATGTRNSPTLANLAWNPSFMWDGGINNIEVMPIAPITNPVEMHETMSNVVIKLRRSEKYQQLFAKAYGGEITDQKLLKALAQYLVMLISDDSKYDKVRRGEESYTATEQAGYDLFVQKCSQCHTEPLFTDYSYRNNGLDETFSDNGRGKITQLAVDAGKFKVPTLRNVEYTYPYMHDGRFFTLNQVLDHYRAGIKTSATLDPMLGTGIAISNIEKQQLIAFLKTLTDYEILNNSELSEPKH